MQKKHWYTVLWTGIMMVGGAAVGGGVEQVSKLITGGNFNAEAAKTAAITGAVSGVIGLVMKQPWAMAAAQMPKPQDPPKS